MTLRFLTCVLVLLAASPQRGKAQEEVVTHDEETNNLVNALTDFIDAHTDEVSEELQGELDQVQAQIEHQRNVSELLEDEIHRVASNAMISPKCDGVIAGSICYVLHNQKLSFDAANASCLNKDSELATIDSEHHYDQVMDYILQNNVFTDRSVVFAWTGLQLEDADDEEHFFHWLPGYPREAMTYNRVAWQTVSIDSFGDHGYLNVPNVASAYPLCQHDVVFDSNECSSDPCHEDATCLDLDGSYTCECNDGFVGDGFSCKNHNSTLDDYTRALPDLMAHLRSKDDEIYSADFYRYNYDSSINHQISDGGLDMYDGGNQIYVVDQNDIETRLEYGSLTTYPGMNFVVAVNDTGYPFYTMIAVTPSDDLRPIQFSVRSNAGADGSGSKSQLDAMLDLTSEAAEHHTFRYVVNQVHGAGDPSICEVFLLGGPSEEMDNVTLSTTFLDGTGSINSRLSVTRPSHQTSAFYIVYALLSKTGGVQIQQPEIENVLRVIAGTIVEEFPDLI